jgi:hypothetical protein
MQNGQGDGRRDRKKSETRLNPIPILFVATYWDEQGRNRVREGSSTITLYNPARLVIYSILSIGEVVF